MTTPTPAQILTSLAFAHTAARALHVVAELGVADRVETEPRSAKLLAQELDVDPDALHRLLRLLEMHGLFVRDDSDGWSHSEASRFLRSDHPTSLRAFARMAGTSFGWESFTFLDHTVRTGEPGVCRLDPAGWMSYLHGHPDQAAIFHESMTAKSHADVAAALGCYDFSRHRRIADVAGGHGHLIRAVLAAYPGTSGVLFELPQVAEQAPSSDRLEVIAGDFFSDPLPAADAYLLMNVVHDWDDAAASSLLRAVADAGRAEAATVLLLEVVMPEGPRSHWAKTLDVMMLALTGGRERTLPEYAALLAGAGLELVRVTPTETPFSLVEARIR